MGKKGGTSWLTAVKRAFRSPTKDSPSVKKSCTRKVENDFHEDEDIKKREKKRWLFRKASSEEKLTSNGVSEESYNNLPADQKHAIAVATATAAAAEAAMAAVEIIRLTRNSNPISLRQQQAATVIQTAFRGFLARRARIALRGIVKLQALIRGQNVRKQAKMTLKCMQALLRVQSRLRDQRTRLSHDGGRRSMFAESTTNLWESSRYIQDIRERKSTSRDGSSIVDDWSECPRTLEELEAILEARKEASFRRERSLAHAFSQQIWDDKELEERPNWVERATPPTKHWDTNSRGSTDKRDSIKTVEIDTLKAYSHSGRRSQYRSPHNRPPHFVPPPITPSPSRTRPPPTHSRPSSPRCLEKSYSTANTPNLRSVPRLNTIPRNSTCGNDQGAVTMPNYMAATESAKAKSRSQSAPRSRPSTPERERGTGLARKRLSYPVVPESYRFGCNNLRSPSFKSVQAGYVGMEQHSNLSIYTDSIGGELSPCSTTELRWLR